MIADFDGAILLAPKLITDWWAQLGSIGFSKINAIVADPNDSEKNVYVFCGDQFIKAIWGSGKVIESPQHISKWKGKR